MNTLQRNPGLPLDLDWVLSVQANTSAIERRCKTLPGRRSIKKEHQAAWLLKALSCIDLTTLSGDDTEQRVRRLCRKARMPVRSDLLHALDVPTERVHAAAICVYHEMVLRQWRLWMAVIFQWRPYPRASLQACLPTRCD